jgi:hypothetical protein
MDIRTTLTPIELRYFAEIAAADVRGMPQIYDKVDARSTIYALINFGLINAIVKVVQLGFKTAPILICTLTDEGRASCI